MSRLLDELSPCWPHRRESYDDQDEQANLLWGLLMITLLSWENINGKEALVWVLTKRGFDEHTHAQTLILDVYESCLLHL